jgi:dolichol kinase
MFIGLFVVWNVGAILVIDFSGSTSGMIPEVKDMARLYFKLIMNPNNIKEVLFSLGWFYYLLFFFFYILNLIMLANEFTRKTTLFAFPFNFICRIFFCEEEKLNYGAYLYFTIGQLFAAFITPPMVFFAILGISSISDLLTSQIGIRYGKNKIKWNKDKSWQGTLAGIISCFLISFFFIGLVWAIIFTIAFLIFDVITNKPLKLSDNLLLPIGLGLIYIVTQFLCNLDLITIFLI